MKKLLLNLLVCAGALSAHAAVGDIVTSLANINSTTAYTLSLAGRGHMPNSNGVAQMYGTDETDSFGKFLIIKVNEFTIGDQNQYVIYSIDNAKFMTNRSTNTNVYDETPAQAFFNLSASNAENRFLIKSSSTDKWLQFGGSNQFLLADGWKTQDAGNRWQLTVAEEDVDATAATTKLNSFLSSYVANESAISNNTTYIVKNVDRSFLNTTTTTTETAANASRVNYKEIAILKGTKGYYLYDVANSKFIGTQNLTSTETPVYHYTLGVHDGASDSKYKFKLTSESTGYMLQSDNRPVLTVTSDWSTADNGNKWAFFPAGTFDSTDAMAKIAEMEAEVSLTPITGLDALSTTKTYVLKNRGFDGYLKGNTNGQRLLYVATDQIISLHDPVFHWEIVNIPDEGYVFRNVGTGTYITNLSNTSSAGQWKMTNDPIFVYNALKEFSDDEGNKYYAIRNIEQSYKSGNVDYAHLHVDGSGNTVNWEESNNHTQYSIAAVETVNDYNATLQSSLLTAATNRINSLTATGLNEEGAADGRIGFLSSEANSTLAAAYETANTVNANESATIHDKVAAIRTLNQQIAEAEGQIVHVEAGKYYTIRGAHEDLVEMYLTESYELTANLTTGSGDEAVTTTHNKLVAANLGENHVPAYWSFNLVEGEGNSAKYNIMAANSGSFMRAVTWYNACLLLPAGHAEVGVYNYMSRTNRQFGGVNICGNDVTLSMTNGNGATENNIMTHNGKVNGNNWIIEPVEYVTVTFNDNGYAAVKFPFAVQLNDEVTAYDLYSVTSADEAITAAHSGNVIPAGTPVFLKGTGSEQLRIVYSDDEATVALADDNESSVTTSLQGSLVPETVENAFVLSGETLVPATGKVPANSAYYVGAAGDTTPKTLSGEITTAINEISMDTTAAEGMVYDLQGRRVSKATRGFYIVNGKKVYMK